MWRSCSPRSPDLWGARPCSWEGQRLAVPRRGERPGRWGSAGGPGSGDPPPAQAAFSIRDGEAIPRPLRQKRGALSDAGGRGGRRSFVYSGETLAEWRLCPSVSRRGQNLQPIKLDI